MRVLIADDSKTIRMLLVSLLRQLGYADVVEAENGQVALERAIAGTVDVMLLDLHMPVLDGLATLRRVKGDQATADIPVLIISSDSDMRKVEEARQLGARGYIRKPFTSDGLRKGIEAALQSLGTRRSNRPA
jgi:two-component system chemotaxis response regulator CheY